MTDASHPPEHLSAEAKSLWKSILVEWDFSDDPVALRILESALEHFDTKRVMQDVLHREGRVIRDRFDKPKIHPAVDAERKADAAMRAAFGSLGLELEPIKGIGRPPGR